MGARIFCAIAAMCLLPNLASAQTALPSAALQMGLPSAPLQTGLPSASLPDRPPEAPIPATRPDLFRAGPDTFAPRFDHLLQPDPRFFPCCSGFVGFAPSKPWWAHRPWWADRASVRRPLQIQQTGYLRLQVQPGTAQVYIDGFFIGSVDDVRGIIRLEPGPHRVELRAPGYETLAFDVRILPNETITYRNDLKAIPPGEKPAPPAPGVPKTFYVIPGCYAGDKPPGTIALPPACDVAKVRTVPPQVSLIRRTPPAP